MASALDPEPWLCTLKCERRFKVEVSGLQLLLGERKSIMSRLESAGIHIIFHPFVHYPGVDKGGGVQ